MHPVQGRPGHGSWIWLGTAVLSATVLTGVALRYVSSRCPAATPVAAATSSPAGAGGGAGFSAPPPASGEAVFYNPGRVAGSCLLGPFPADGLYVSLPPQQYDGGAACGTYLDVQGPRGRVRAEVVDLCPDCAATSINLDRAAFQRVAGTDAVSAPVTYRPAADPALPGPVIVHVAATVSGLPTLQVINHGNRLTAVAVAPSARAGARWQPLALGPNGFWVASARPAAGTVALRITDNLGHQVVIPRVTLAPGSTIRSRVMMYQPGGPTATATASAGPAAPVTVSGRPASAGGHC